MLQLEVLLISLLLKLLDVVGQLLGVREGVVYFLYLGVDQVETVLGACLGSMEAQMLLAVRLEFALCRFLEILQQIYSVGELQNGLGDSLNIVLLVSNSLDQCLAEVADLGLGLEPELLQAVVLLHNLLRDSRLELHVVHYYLLALLQPLVLHLKAFLDDFLCLPDQVTQFRHLELQLVLLLVNGLEDIYFPISGIVSHYLSQLLQLVGLFVSREFKRVNTTHRLEYLLRKRCYQILNHLPHTGLHLEPLELP